MGSMGTLILYTHPDCHLCAEMEALLAEVAPYAVYETLNIQPDLGLVYRYGTRVPVLRRTDTGAELDWPADEERLSRFLSA